MNRLSQLMPNDQPRDTSSLTKRHSFDEFHPAIEMSAAQHPHGWLVRWKLFALPPTFAFRDGQRQQDVTIIMWPTASRSSLSLARKPSARLSAPQHVQASSWLVKYS